MYQLNKWCLTESRGDVLIGYADGIPVLQNVPEYKGHDRAHGIVKGHHRFSDGEYIHTSRIEKFYTEVEEGRFVITTHSGSRYELKFEEIDGKRVSDTMKVLGKYEVPIGVFTICGSAAQRNCARKEMEEKEAAERRIREADDMISEEELWLVIGDKQNYACYKNKEGKMEEVPVGLNVGIFEERHCIRIPHEKKMLDFYAMKLGGYSIEPCEVRGLETVWLKNESRCDVELTWDEKTYLCEKMDVKKIDLRKVEWLDD